MKIDTIITLEFTRFGLKIPERIFVKLNSRLTFKVSNAEIFRKTQQSYNAEIQLYFEGRVPARTERIHRLSLSDQDTSAILFTAVMEELGDYKYGIRIIENDHEIFDEDPFISVYI